MAKCQSDNTDPTRMPANARRNSKRKAALLGAVAFSALASASLLENVYSPSPALAQVQSAERPSPPASAQAVPSFADVVDRVKPAVVSVRVKTPAPQARATGPGGGSFDLPDYDLPPDHPFQEFLRRYRGFGDRFGDRGFGDNENEPRGPRPGPGPRRFGQSQGSGFFISADGFLVTNNHVIDRSSEVQVLTDDGRTLDAKVVGTDPKTDLALLKVEGTGFPFVPLASEAPRVGDWVLAVGNPFGLGGTVTAGIVSARARDIGAGPYDDFLQIDAPINRGNSGGPTFNLRGEVIGVNTAIASPSGGNVGVAFAIPSETVQRIVAQIKEKGTVERGFLGVQIQPVTKDIAAGIGLDKTEGAIVSRIEEGSPAAKAGLRTGDVILSVNGKTVRDARDLSRQIAFMGPGTTATLQVWREGASRDLPVTIGRLAGDQRAGVEAERTDRSDTGPDKLGLSLAPAPSVVGPDGRGVAIVGVEPNSPAAEKGLKAGDVIADVAGRAVETPADVRRAIEDSRKDGKRVVLFRLETRDGSRFVAVPVPAA
jgi:serine protease Do